MGSTNQYRCPSSKYRLPSSNINALLLPGPQSSQFHTSCIPKETKERVKSAPPRSKDSRYAARDYSLCNHVGEDQKWTERCKKERNLQSTWESKFGFLMEYDQKGNPRPRRKAEEKNNNTKSSQYLSNFPSAASQHIGRRCQSAPAQRMQRLEFTMHRGKRRSKDLVYYD